MGNLKPTHVNMVGRGYSIVPSIRWEKVYVPLCSLVFFLSICEGWMPRSARRQLSNRKIFAILCLRFSDFLVVFSPSPPFSLEVPCFSFFSSSFYVSLRHCETLLGVYYWQQ